jgi:hypothetical protein
MYKKVGNLIPAVAITYYPDVFVIFIAVPQATTAFFGQNRVKPTHIYYLHSNGPTYTTSTTSDHNLIHKQCSNPNYNPDVFVLSL